MPQGVLDNTPFSGQYPRRPRRRRNRRRSPVDWALLALVLCLVLLATLFVLRAFRPADRAAQPPSPDPQFTAAEPFPSPSPLPSPSLEPEGSPAPLQSGEVQPPETTKAEDNGEWFSDAVFIGDSRVDGLRLYSGITPDATFLVHTGLSIYAVANGKEVLPRDGKKVSILDALSQGTYGKVYLSLGINELGYFDPAGFGRTYGKVIDAVRECQPDAKLYVQALIPVNTAKCKEAGMAYYITNEGVASYNEALAEVCGEKDVVLLRVPETLLDENGEVAEALTTDGVHFKKEGYARWLEHLASQTQTEEGSP